MPFWWLEKPIFFRSHTLSLSLFLSRGHTPTTPICRYVLLTHSLSYTHHLSLSLSFSITHYILHTPTFSHSLFILSRPNNVGTYIEWIDAVLDPSIGLGPLPESTATGKSLKRIFMGKSWLGINLLCIWSKINQRIFKSNSSYLGARSNCNKHEMDSCEWIGN